MAISSPAEPSAAPKEHIKRPPNAWVIYRKVKSEEYRKAHPDRKFTLPEMSGIMATQWASEPEEEIRRFEQLAMEMKLEHRERHPDYRYQPRRRSPGDEQKKPRKVKEGRVTKPKRTTKDKVVLTATDVTTTDATNTGHGWPEVNGPSRSDGVFGLGSVIPVNDQHALTSSDHMFYDNIAIVRFTHVHTFILSLTALSQSLQSFENLIAKMFNPTVQSMAYPCRSYADSSHVAMQPFATSQVNAYQPMSNGGTLSNAQSYAGRSLQPSNAYEANSLYDVAAGLSESYATTSSQIDSISDFLDYIKQSMPPFIDVAPGNEQVSLDATATEFQDLSAFCENLDFLAFDQESISWEV
ncbi:hypothetical protein C0992_009766 [Termitomyces sp. T32_za158]|nr:hypothetical protein C0992_009766 [Termitomyces sp. T32_za158]